MTTDEILGEGKYLRLRKRGKWEFAERTRDGRAVAVVAVTDKGNLLLVEQDRPAIGSRAIELPAGMVGDTDEFAGESMAVAAERELLEETGYACEQMTMLASGPPSPGAIDETIAFFRATGLRRVDAGGGDDSEDIVVHEVPVDRVETFLREREADGLAVDCKVWAGLYFVSADAGPLPHVAIDLGGHGPARADSPTGLALRDALLTRLDEVLPALPNGRRIGILGGTFDPPHVGHALLAHTMLATEGLDELWVIPVFEHPFGKGSAAFDHRVKMCERAFGRLQGAVRVVPIERELPRPSYTVQTLSALHAVRPGIKPTLVIGSDIIAELSRWRDPERLPHLSRLVVVPRQGAPRIEPPADLDIKIHRGFRLPKVSSTAIKKALASGASVDGWLDVDVLAYIGQHSLY